MTLEKFDIVVVNLDPRKGHAQAGIRPAVIVQSNLFNRHAATIIVVPLTSKEKKLFPSEFLISPSHRNGLTAPSRFLGSQLMTLDKTFVVKRLGQLEEKYYAQAREALRISLDFENDFV